MTTDNCFSEHGGQPATTATDNQQEAVETNNINSEQEISQELGITGTSSSNTVISLIFRINDVVMFVKVDVYDPPLSIDSPSTFLCHDLPSTCSFSIDDIDDGLDALKNVKRSIDCGVFPFILKISSVTPIFKLGDKNDVKNYRKVSILSHISKIFEQLVLRNIQSSVNSIPIDEQYGFRPGRSATMNLMVFNNFVLEAVKKHIQVDVIYTDFAKAFDRVDHGCLIDALYKFGFGEPLLSWFKSYISD
ncbi:hypothetical protein QTP88_010824 [Uroleucon formosanum]